MTIPEILESDWFKKGYKPPQFEQEDTVNLDDVDAIFEKSEVIFLKLSFLCTLFQYHAPVIMCLANSVLSNNKKNASLFFLSVDQKVYDSFFVLRKYTINLKQTWICNQL